MEAMFKARLPEYERIDNMDLTMLTNAQLSTLLGHGIVWDLCKEHADNDVVSARTTEWLANADIEVPEEAIHDAIAYAREVQSDDEASKKIFDYSSLPISHKKVLSQALQIGMMICTDRSLVLPMGELEDVASKESIAAEQALIAKIWGSLDVEDAYVPFVKEVLLGVYDTLEVNVSYGQGSSIDNSNYLLSAYGFSWDEDSRILKELIDMM